MEHQFYKHAIYQQSPYRMLDNISSAISNSTTRTDSATKSTRAKIIDYLCHLSIKGWLEFSSSFFSQFRQLEELDIQLSQPSTSSLSQECQNEENFWHAFIHSQEFREELSRLEGLEHKLTAFLDGQFYYAFNPNHFTLALKGLKAQVLNSYSMTEVFIPQEAFENERSLSKDVRQRLRLWRMVRGILGVEVAVDEDEDETEDEEDEEDWEMSSDSDCSSISFSESLQSSMSIDPSVGDPSFEDISESAIFHSLSLISSDPFSSLGHHSGASSNLTHPTISPTPSSPPTSRIQSLMARKFKSSSSHPGNISSGRFIPNLEPVDMGFRIIRSQNLRTIAQELFNHEVSGRWCRIHRLSECRACFLQEDIHPAFGKVERKSSLFNFIPDFIILSAYLFVSNCPSSRKATISIQPTWYLLMTDLLTSSLLELYLVDKMKGTRAVEVLFGLGTNVSGNESNDTEQEGDDELVKASNILFGNFTPQHADFTRSLLDRTHELLDVPTQDNLESHLEKLSKKYPLSSFISRMREFLNCASDALGRPELTNNDLIPNGSAFVSDDTVRRYPLENYVKFE